jgi:hypothetical protein
MAFNRILDRTVKHRCALSLIEVVASTMIVGLMTVAALNSLGAATRTSDSIGNRAVAQGLADDLVSEILQLPYGDPDQTPDFGLENGETTGSRYAFDDADDYNGWSEQPPRPKSWRGAYSNTTSYSIDDIVEYQGASYVCKTATTGHVPSDVNYWKLTKQIGDDRANWRRLVTVSRVVPANPTQTSATDQGAKRIRITVEYGNNNKELVELVVVRTDN